MNIISLVYPARHSTFAEILSEYDRELSTASARLQKLLKETMYSSLTEVYAGKQMTYGRTFQTHQ
jgi:uncharacterized protein YeaO (DUF488 family)